MSNLLENLHPSSFRGVNFFISTTELEGGRNQATFNFINTGRRSVQDIGAYRDCHDITGYIMGNAETYFENRDKLLDALNTQGAGILVHPFYGSLTVTTGKYRLNESTRSLGYSEIKFKAEVVDVAIISEEGNIASEVGNQVTPSSIEEDAQNAKDKLAEDIAEDTTLIPEFPANFSSIEQIIQSGLSQYQEVMAPIADNIDNAIGWVNGVSNLAQDVNRLINEPTVLFANIIDTVTGIDNLTSNAFKASAQLEKLFDLGRTSSTSPNNVSNQLILNTRVESLSTDDLIPEEPEFETKDKQQVDRKNNADQINLMYESAALIEYMNQLSRADFENDKQIDVAIEQIETQYNTLQPFLSENSLDAITTLRTNLCVLFDTRKINSNKIADIDVQHEPISVLSYYLYADSTQADSIASLNEISDMFDVNGQIQVESDDRNKS